MNDRRAQIWIAVVAGIALAALALLAGSATASLSEPALALPPDVNAPSHVDQTTLGWGSGWITLTPGTAETLTHNLGGDPDDYAVDLWFMDTDAGGYGINARSYGGMEAGEEYYGAAWQHLTSNTIQVIRFANDTFADYVRVRVWVPDPMPDYCSDWTLIGLGQTRVFTHSLGGNVDDYSVGMMFNSAARGITHFAYGGLEFNTGTYVGAYWSDLNSSTVRVTRYAGGLPAAQVRICVTLPDSPDYDSGWVAVTQGTTETLSHDLLLNPNQFRVRMSRKSGDGDIGINNIGAGGMVDAGDHSLGVNWENLTANTIDVFRRSQDVHSDQVRVRIWARTHKIYLPHVLNDYGASE